MSPLRNLHEKLCSLPKLPVELVFELILDKVVPILSQHKLTVEPAERDSGLISYMGIP